MRTVYRVLAYLLALSVAAQASLIAFGAFALENNIDNGPVSDGDTTGVTLHHSFAYVVLLCAVALFAVSFGAKVPHGVRWAAIPLGLVVVQFFLAYAAYSAAIIGVLHGLLRASPFPQHSPGSLDRWRNSQITLSGDPPVPRARILVALLVVRT